MQQIADEKGISFQFEKGEIQNLANSLSEVYYRPNMSSRRLDKIMDLSVREPLSNAFFDNINSKKFKLSFDQDSSENVFQVDLKWLNF